MPVRSLFVIFMLLLCGKNVYAQAIKGEVLDEDKQPVSGVHVENIYTSLAVQSGEQGAFIIAATSDQLLEFKKTGYKTTRVRVPKGYVPPYFRIIMKKGIADLNQSAIAGRYDYKKDSLRYYELYKNILDFPKMSAVQTIAHPFTAMSRVNQQKWRFQDRYMEFEEQKYVDRTFNAALIAKTTGLRGDSLQAYIRRFRPSYEQLRMMNDYTFYLYIKSTVNTFRSRFSPRNSQ